MSSLTVTDYPPDQFSGSWGENSIEIAHEFQNECNKNSLTVTEERKRLYQSQEHIGRRTNPLSLVIKPSNDVHHMKSLSEPVRWRCSEHAPHGRSMWLRRSALRLDQSRRSLFVVSRMNACPVRDIVWMNRVSEWAFETTAFEMISDGDHHEKWQFLWSWTSIIIALDAKAMLHTGALKALVYSFSRSLQRMYVLDTLGVEMKLHEAYDHVPKSGASQSIWYAHRLFRFKMWFHCSAGIRTVLTCRDRTAWHWGYASDLGTQVMTWNSLKLNTKLRQTCWSVISADSTPSET